MEFNSKIYVAGHKGMVGSAIVRALSQRGYSNIALRSRSELDLFDNRRVSEFFHSERPEYVFLAAAKVGGILANDQKPVEFLTENLAIQSNVIQSACDAGVEKLLFLGSSCIYPKFAPQPIAEDSLLTGALEPTNEAYALAKIVGLKLCAYMMRERGKRMISAMPTNLYGPNDNYDLNGSHVLPALIRRYHSAKINEAPTVTLWGSGSPMREFLHVDDLAEACLFLMDTYENMEPINVGTGEDLSIYDLAATVRDVVGYQGETLWDKTKPDGTPRKLLNVSRIHALGWKHKIELKEGIRQVYAGVDTSLWQ